MQAKTKKEFFMGAAAALGAAVTFGVSTPLSKLILEDISPFLLAGLLYLGSGLCLLVVLLFRRKTPLQGVGRKEAAPLSAAILFGGVIGPVLLLLGLNLTPSSNASLLLNLEGVFTALLAWCVFGELFNKRIGVGMLLITAGGVALSWSGFEQTGILGPLFIGGACLSWGLDNNFTRKVSSCDAVQIAALKGIVAGSVNTSLALFMGAKVPPALLVVECALLGFISFGLSLTLFVVALRYIGAARTGAYFSTAPFIGALGALFLGENLNKGVLLAGLLMGGGVWLHLTESIESAGREG